MTFPKPQNDFMPGDVPPSPAASAPRAEPIRVERFQPEKHYEAISGWWRAQNWPVVPLHDLSSTGLVVYHAGKPAAAAWIYKTDSALCWLEWIVASPEVRREERSAVLSVLISTARVTAQVMGFRALFTSTASQSLAARMSAHGFDATDQGMTNYFCDLSKG